LDSIFSIVAGSVRNAFQLRVVKCEVPENSMGHLEVCRPFSTSNTIRFAAASLLEDSQNGPAMIRDMEPLTDLIPFTIDRKALTE
jgi:hypothetical protein